MMLFPVLLSNLQRLSTAFEKKKITQNAVFISVLSDFNRARDVAKRPGDVCSVTTEAERRPRTFEPRQGSKTRKGYPFGYPFLVPLRARDGTRTRGPDLGKVVLHQLSHSRIACCVGYVCRTHLISYSVNENLSTPFFIFFEKLEQFVILKRF